jgi:hypothetical protein
VHPALAHLARTDTVAPTLSIDLWDVRLSGISAPREEVLSKSWRLGDGIFAASDDGRIVSHQLGGTVIWFDRARREMVGWYADGRDVSLHQRGKPLQLLLALWASDRGLQAVHAALVARADAGVLIRAAAVRGSRQSRCPACWPATPTLVTTGSAWP